jgi:hypothetical protein
MAFQNNITSQWKSIPRLLNPGTHQWRLYEVNLLFQHRTMIKWVGVYLIGRAFALHMQGPGTDSLSLQTNKHKSDISHVIESCVVKICFV